MALSSDKALLCLAGGPAKTLSSPMPSGASLEVSPPPRIPIPHTRRSTDEAWTHHTSGCSSPAATSRLTGGGESSGTSAPPVAHCLHQGYSSRTLRSWQGVAPISPANLVYPLFVTHEADGCEEIPSMPGQCRYGYRRVVSEVERLVHEGLRAVLLFGVVPQSVKDSTGSWADCPESPVVLALQLLSASAVIRSISTLLVADVCLCEYTDHGHCGLLNPHGRIANTQSIQRLAEVSLAYVKAGADVIAPSDMMDGRVAAIKQLLKSEGYEHIPVMSYSSKFASCFYGPFRDAAGSAPGFGDRKGYQLPPGSRGLAIRASVRDADEGADFLMVKPAGVYLDVIREVRNRTTLPIAAYQVSGEYAMLYFGAQHGAFDLKTAVLETITSIQRAGADIVISYFTPQLLKWLKEQ
ncbi:unnamed protein product [Vitrella brassicaformis CCMP3155]|uniref:Delta-aminolevulinic acid dehydratase n=1 Tax=Vitrella brassicaformis (strain CCMP3155) TaxID=1169540 RepID=A0A0G4EBX8_VITBC|nr:unnamed protein product [Vitrella brassicaformis CCMP3155]|mmetsp:Transcript_24997/g.72139  ORF Transcript_24997/g.72139 Transcript_24997/m.72139 type:complete len:410 (+) Transcript_24997:84-1313(+)|eukprot:CEL93170.1 unnamed protein product [Vitrella brassicaformis CCMP3155]